jgi:putative membrane protein
MWLDALLAYAHHLAAFGMVAVLAAEVALLSSSLTPQRLRVLGPLDSVYGALAVTVLVIGGLRAVYGAKGWAFYADNPAFWAKLAVFGAAALISIVPTVRFLRWRKHGDVAAAEALRASTRTFTIVQAALLAAIPLLAALMARGIGH